MNNNLIKYLLSLFGEDDTPPTKDNVMNFLGLNTDQSKKDTNELYSKLGITPENKQDFQSEQDIFSSQQDKEVTDLLNKLLEKHRTSSIGD